MMAYFRHGTAVIDPGAEIGDGARVWHFVHVCAGARVGRNVVLGQNAFVADGAVIGDDCKLQNNVSVYDGVVLERGVFCGPSAVFTNVKNPRAEVNRKNEYLRTLVKEGATLGANCTVVCGATIGCFAFVAAGAVITTDVLDYALVAGVPARQIGWMSRYGDKLDLAVGRDGETTCPRTGERYVVQEGKCRVL